MEWDTAAGDAVLRAAGGIVARRRRRAAAPTEKSAQGLRNGGFVAWGDPAPRRARLIVKNS